MKPIEVKSLLTTFPFLPTVFFVPFGFFTFYTKKFKAVMVGSWSFVPSFATFSLTGFQTRLGLLCKNMKRRSARQKLPLQ
jgi:hypothetical protein